MIQNTDIINEVFSSDVMTIVFSDVYGFAITCDKQGIREHDHKMRKMYLISIDLQNKRKLLDYSRIPSCNDPPTTLSRPGFPVPYP